FPTVQLSFLLSFFFFFQAEDGIRVFHVTGVDVCSSDLSKADGAVAAPTAGLHFTDDVLKSVKEKGIKTDFLTLHVSAGTFQPVTTENALEHAIHEEQVIITRQDIDSLLDERGMGRAVGTTSM